MLTFAVDMDASVGRWGSGKHVGEEGRRSDRMRANDRTDFVSLNNANITSLELVRRGVSLGQQMQGGSA